MAHFIVSARRRSAVAFVALAAAMLATTGAHASSLKTWSGTIKLATWTDFAGLGNGAFGVALQPFDPSSPLNDQTSASRDVSTYSDGHYKARIHTGPLQSNLTSTTAMKVDLQLTSGAIVHVSNFGASESWTLIACLPRNVKYLRVAPAAFQYAQQDVSWTIDVVDHTC